uniref:Histone-lysine N-methyltransferase lin-59 n=1 Tax=Ascaris suum TaxID=6253 RepID=F1KQR0_ASCSU
MSFEAVPCMFRSTANDGNSSSYIGLLIRPSGSGSASQGAGTTVNAAVVGGTPNGPKSLHVVPSSLKANAPSQAPKVVVPAGVQLRLQPAVCATPQCNDAWIHTTARPAVNTTFDSPSPSQVVPQMNVGDSYECSVPCASSGSFFPPISSITQNLSSAKSEIDLLQEISSVEMNVMRNQKVTATSGDYSHNTTPQRYHTNTIQNIYSAQTQAEIQVGRMPSCRYQSGYNGANDCSATPDSGIQSIAGSPPSSGPFTPPLRSPAPCITLASNDVIDTTSRPSASVDDFSDMPRLIPFHQMEEASSPFEEEAPQMENLPKANKCSEQMTASQSVDDVPKIAITPAMNVNELVEQIISHMDAEQRKQFATVIKSKVETCEEVERAETLQRADSAIDDHHTAGGEATCKENSRRSGSRRRGQADSSNERRECSQQGTSSQEGSHRTEHSKQREVEKQLSKGGDEVRKRKRHLRDGVERVKKSETPARSEQNVFKKERASSEKPFSGDSSKRDGKDLLTEGELHKEKRRWARSEDGRKLQTDMEEKPAGEEDKEEKEDHARLKRKEELEAWERIHRLEREEVGERVKRKEEDVREELKSREEEELREQLNEREEEEARERLRAYRIGVKRKLNEQLKSVIERVEKQLSNLELNLGPRMHWNLPWYRLNWKDVAQRIVERDRLEKLAKEKDIVTKKTTARKKLRKLAVRRSESSSLEQSTSDKHHSAAKSYIKIKHNVIVDAYPRIEQLQCSCQKGSCGESDECLNRMVQMECNNSCGRGVHCSNKRIFRRECVDKLSLFETSNGRGLGVRTDVPLQKGQFVCEYVGEVVSMETFDARNAHSYRAFRNHYALNLCPGYVIDAYQKGNIARFVNHSCVPNCEMQRWSVNGQHRIGLFALRVVAKGEELTYDYNWDSFDFYGVTPCSCGVPNCRGFLNKNVLMNAKEKELARSSGVLLLRNVRKSAKRKMAAARSDNKTSKPCVSYRRTLRNFADDMLSAFDDREVMSRKRFKQIKKNVDEVLHQSTASLFFGSALHSVESHFIEAFGAYKKRQPDRKKVHALKARLDDIREDHKERLRKFGALPSHFEEQLSSKQRSKGTSHRIISATADLSYLESEVAVGSYDTDCLTHLGPADTDSDCVRCICGITDDDGSMVQCDTCHFWLHEECVVVKHGGEFKCEICRTKATRTPAVDIVLRSQPHIRFKRCVYYRTLVNVHNIQVRINETVYLQKLATDDHKAELRRLNETSKGDDTSTSQPMSPRKLKPNAQRFQPKTFARKDLRCFRVERLFASPEGHNFVFGFYYARPHEVYCEPGRMFHEREVFATPMFDTLPLDAVVGRCLVLEPRVYVLGRPRMPRYDEADVYFCEYQTGKNSRYFEKIPSRNHYYINTEPHNFIRFSIEPSLSRTFTPFVMERHAEGGNDLTMHGCRQTAPSSSSKKVLEQKRARLESIIASLPSSNEHYAPPRKIARHSSR